jgi:uncharacterized UBP type Zn finger protein
MSENTKSRSSLSDVIRRFIWSGKIQDQGCSHLDQIQDVSPNAEGCEDCLKIGDSWVHLRMCMICGHVGCCDNSKNKHATAHYRETGHPLIVSLEPNEEWMWCYVDRVLISSQ